MKFKDLSEEQQQMILKNAEFNNIAPTEINLDIMASIYDDTINTNLITPSITVGSATVAAGATTLTSFDDIIRSTRNEIIETMLDDTLKKTKEYGENLVKINYNRIASPLCEKRQNKIYWIDVPDDKYDELDPELWRNGGGLFHPNCRHNMTAYFEEYSDETVIDPITDKEREKLYKEQQELNYIKRNKKKFYNRKEMSRITDNSSYTHNKNKWKEWTARENAFIAKNGTRRE